MNYIQVKDLIVCTQVNSKWEEEARRHLRTRIKSRVSLSQDGKMEGPYNRERVEIGWTNCADLTEFLRRFKIFAVENRKRVRHLKIDVFLDEGPDTVELFEIIKILGDRLTWLHLVPFLVYPNRLQRRGNLAGFLADFNTRNDLVFPQIRKVKFDKTRILRDGWGVWERGLASIETIVAKFAPLFPNARVVKFKNVEELGGNFLFSGNSPPFPRMELMSIHSDGEVDPSIRSFWESNMPLIYLTRLEFNVARCDTAGVILLRVFAPSLEHVHISGIDWFGVGSNVIEIPIMEKLKIFKISRDIRSECRAVPSIRFKFETEDVANRIRIDYGKQFPVLESLVVQCKTWSRNNTDPEICFESSAQFLYATFLPGNIAVCETLRKLDVPLPPRDRFRLMVGNDRTKGCSYSVCNCWEWEKSSRFLDRVAATFPNVRYEYLEERRLRRRADEVKEWIKMGIAMGLLVTGSGEGDCDGDGKGLKVGEVLVRFRKSDSESLEYI